MKVSPVLEKDAKDELLEIYTDIRKNMGGKVPNIFQYMGNSLPVLKAFFALNAALSDTSLSPKLREQIALAVAESNHCHYCLSAHSAIASSQRIEQQEILDARKGIAKDDKTKAILKFVKLVVEKRGQVLPEDVQELKKHNVSDQELAEIALAINANMFTNYFNHIMDTPIDFPLAPKL